MVRNYKRKTIDAYPRESIAKAVEMINNKQMSIYQAVLMYGIPRSTLASRLYKTRKSDTRGRPTYFKPSFEKTLAEVLISMEEQGFSFTRKHILDLIGQFMVNNNLSQGFKTLPGEYWFDGFKKRNEFTPKMPKPEIARKKVDSNVVQNFNELLREATSNLENMKEIFMSKPEEPTDRPHIKIEIVENEHDSCSRTSFSLEQENITESLADDDSDHITRKQINEEQLNSLLEYMKEHQELAKGLIRGRRGKLLTLKLWNKCANILNSVQDGAVKDGKGWAKYWCDWKYRVRRRALELKVGRNGDEAELVPLSDMEVALLEVIGESSVDGVVLKDDPLAKKESDVDSCNDDNARENNQYYDDPRPRLSKTYKRANSDNSEDDEDGVINPKQRRKYKSSSKPVEDTRSRLSEACKQSSSEHSEDDEDEIINPKLRRKHENLLKHEQESVGDSKEFLRIERAKLENSNKIVETLNTLTRHMEKIADALTCIKDNVVNNNKINTK